MLDTLDINFQQAFKIYNEYLQSGLYNYSYSEIMRDVVLMSL
jgi:hypothetical protein